MLKYEPIYFLECLNWKHPGGFINNPFTNPRTIKEINIFPNFRLTAYVSLAFSQARSYIYVDDNIIRTALAWLSENQAANGSFVETGNVVHEELQNRDDKSLALTAYVLLTFQENQVIITNTY